MNNSKDNNLVFGLDIGTRSIVGTVGYKLSEKSFVVEAMCVREHNTRAMLDGQIHDIYQVTQTVLDVKQNLERMVGTKLENVCIAAAGRVLMTQTVNTQIEYGTDHVVSQDDVYSLDLKGVEEAYIRLQEQLQNKDIRFYCVGYNAVNYYLNGYTIAKLQGHRAQKVGVELLATFLPEEVIEGLYSAVEGAGLKVVNLTLEPIAAINVAIPEKFRLLNIALVDVGAGTSDICITNDGAVCAYGMIPKAGDELTEILARKFLIEFNEAERIKVESTKKKQVSFTDIMGIRSKVNSEVIQEIVKEEFAKITKAIADKIIELNGNKTVSAVFVVGGGGKYPGFVESLAAYLNLPQTRVALRGEEVLSDVLFRQADIKKDSLIVTPIGICLNYYENKNTFVKVKANGANIKIFDNNSLTVADVAMQIGIKNEELFPMLGKSLTFKVNDKLTTVRGLAGEPAVLKLNGKTAALTTPIKDKDEVEIQVSTRGEDASVKLADVRLYKPQICILINKNEINIPIPAQVNGHFEDKNYQIKENDDIHFSTQITLADVIKYADLDPNAEYSINGEILEPDNVLHENDDIKCVDRAVAQDNKNSDGVSDSHTNQQEIENTDLNNGIINQTAVPKSMSGIAKYKEETQIFITVNSSVVRLTGKKSYIFVDILDFYDFDTKTLGGTKLVLTVNGLPADFTTPLSDGDNTQIYWK